MNLELTMEEANYLVNLLDAEVKRGGLGTPRFATSVAYKIIDAAQPKQQAEEREEFDG